MTGFHAEFHRAATWAETKLSFDKNLNAPRPAKRNVQGVAGVNYFETSIRHLGGLLSVFLFSQRPGLLLKASDLARRLAQEHQGVAHGSSRGWQGVKAFPQNPLGPSHAGGSSAARSESAGWAAWLSKAQQFLQQVFENFEEPGSWGPRNLHIVLMWSLEEVNIPNFHLVTASMDRTARETRYAEAFTSPEM
eukprot:Skav214713  [mRNA]  locus=scaffold2250:111318:113632:+ [translate_table: standard]